MQVVLFSDGPADLSATFLEKLFFHRLAIVINIVIDNMDVWVVFFLVRGNDELSVVNVHGTHVFFCDLHP